MACGHDIGNAVRESLRLEDFVPDAPATAAPAARLSRDPDWIDGVEVSLLAPHSDERGSLVELLTTREGPIEPIVHVYHVTSLPGSCRAWVYHRHQFDRLAFVAGHFRVALYDIRANSATRHRLNVFDFGIDKPSLLRIPPFVVHGVKNVGIEVSSFVNMPTRAYLPNDPDKCRLPANDPRIPFSFDD